MRVLLIDDSTDITQLLGQLLEIRGYEVRTESTGAAGLSTAREFLPDGILVDLTLPDMSGYELARRLRQLPSLDDARIVAFSGSEPEPERFRQAGFDQRLLKPAKVAALVAALDPAPAVS